MDNDPRQAFTSRRVILFWLASALGVKELLPAYLGTTLGPEDLLTGVSFASSGSGFDPLTPAITVLILSLKPLLGFSSVHWHVLVNVYPCLLIIFGGATTVGAVAAGSTGTVQGVQEEGGRHCRQKESQQHHLCKFIRCMRRERRYSQQLLSSRILEAAFLWLFFLCQIPGTQSFWFCWGKAF